MKLLQRADRDAYRAIIVDERAQGRLPIAMLTFGNIFGHGWGFLQPWAQLAVFPNKGTHAGVGDPERLHEPFWILRLRPTWTRAKHRNMDWEIEGRFWLGLAWRKSWGYRRLWRVIPIWRFRPCLLDPDIVKD